MCFCSKNSLLAQYSLNGDAEALGNDCYSITQQGFTFQNGSVWYDDAIDLDLDFNIQFYMYYGSDDAGADGMMFVLHQQGPNALGISGSGMGFEGFAPSLGIEFDTYQNNEEGDLFEDHMAIHRNGNVNHFSGDNLSGPVTINPLGLNVEDGQEHVITVTWDSSDQTLEIYFDCELRLSLTNDIINTIFGGDSEVTWGFTGATGGLTNDQYVCLDAQILGLQEEYAICNGESVTLSVNGDLNGSFEWSPTNGLSDPNSSQTEASPVVDTEYTITYTDLCGNQQTESTLVSVGNPELDLGEDLSICEGGTVNVTISDLPGTNYLWDNGSTELTRTLQAGEIYWAEASQGNCTVRDSIEVFALPLPQTDIFEDASICENEELNLEFNDPNFIITWPDDSQGNTFSTSTEGVFSFVLSDVGTGCENDGSFELEVTPLPSPQNPEEITACNGESVTIEANAPADSYEWSTGSLDDEIIVNNSGYYTVTLNNQNCEASATTHVIYFANPEPDLGPDLELCQGESTVLSSGPEQANWSYQWNGIQGSFETEVEDSGTYTLVVTDNESGCSGIDVVEVIINDKPEIVAPGYIEICVDEPKVLTAESFGADEAFWQGFDSDSIEVAESGLFIFEAINVCGSSFATTLTQVVNCDCNIFIPNAFTPNEDGLNDIFRVEIDCDYFDYYFRIFNRWGQLLFESQDPNDVWLGNHSSGEHYVPDGTYIWTVEYKSIIFNEIRSFDKSGTVTILR